MRWWWLLLVVPHAMALECKAPARLVQAAGENQTLMSWCEVDGAKEGPFEQFSVQHGLEVRANYAHGKLEGPFQRFFPDGKVASEGQFKNDEMSGEWTRYSASGERRDVTKWAGGNSVTAAPKTDTHIRTSDSYRIRFGVAHVTSGDNNGGDNGGPELGVDFHLFELGRWLRFELDARVMPDYSRNGDGSGNHEYSAALGLAFEPLSGFLSPFALTIAPGPYLVHFKDARFGGFIGLRYQWQPARPGFHIHGVYVQGGGHDNKDNGCSYCGQNGGPGQGSQQGSGGGSQFLEAGVLFTI